MVDFNKSCEESRGKFLPLSGIPVYYCLCENCGFCFAPDICEWQLDEFARKIYNSEYAEVDPDYLEARPRANAQYLVNLFGDDLPTVRHLDYGGGNGLLSELLFQTGWRSFSYDPFVNEDVCLADLGKFELITAYEVFEHVPNADRLATELASLLAPDGLILFSTLLSDGNLGAKTRLTWWYASPRNGHISLFSQNSLKLLGAKQEFNFASFSDGFHAYWRQTPDWAPAAVRSHLLHATETLPSHPA